ncbi:DUF309 domain-containing protein [Halobellus sp. Atlit-31R]|nr:DUF309 domain-containing protein [Halobellus sp. Atlit-31R]
MEDALRVGVAVFNAGDHRAAHDAWEEPWLDCENGTSDERLLHGLIQYAAAVHHARRRNWSGARGLAESAAAYLAEVDDDRGINVGDVRTYLRRLAADPELAERRRPLALRYDGDALVPTDLSFENAAAAATLLAREYDAFEVALVEDAVRYAREAVDADSGGPDGDAAGDASPRAPDGPSSGRSRGFVGLVFDFAADRERRALVYDRLRAHVERRRSRERDVSGLFE